MNVAPKNAYTSSARPAQSARLRVIGKPGNEEAKAMDVEAAKRKVEGFRAVSRICGAVRAAELSAAADVMESLLAALAAANARARELEAENARLRAALAPFAELAKYCTRVPGGAYLTLVGADQCRRAAALLASEVPK